MPTVCLPAYSSVIIKAYSRPTNSLDIQRPNSKILTVSDILYQTIPPPRSGLLCLWPGRQERERTAKQSKSRPLTRASSGPCRSSSSAEAAAPAAGGGAGGARAVRQWMRAARWFARSSRFLADSMSRATTFSSRRRPLLLANHVLSPSETGASRLRRRGYSTVAARFSSPYTSDG